MDTNLKVRMLVGIIFSAIILAMWVLGFTKNARQQYRWQWTSNAISKVNKVALCPYVPINLDLENMETVSTSIVITNRHQITELATNIASGQYDRKLWKNSLEHWGTHEYVLIKFTYATQEVMYAVNKHSRYPIASAIECKENGGIMRMQGRDMRSDKLYAIINEIVKSNKASWVKGETVTDLQR